MKCFHTEISNPKWILSFQTNPFSALFKGPLSFTYIIHLCKYKTTLNCLCLSSLGNRTHLDDILRILETMSLRDVCSKKNPASSQRVMFSKKLPEERCQASFIPFGDSTPAHQKVRKVSEGWWPWLGLSDLFLIMMILVLSEWPWQTLLQG